jgi:hypothetical protein
VDDAGHSAKEAGITKLLTEVSGGGGGQDDVLNHWIRRRMSLLHCNLMHGLQCEL